MPKIIVLKFGTKKAADDHMTKINNAADGEKYKLFNNVSEGGISIASTHEEQWPPEDNKKKLFAAVEGQSQGYISGVIDGGNWGANCIVRLAVA